MMREDIEAKGAMPNNNNNNYNHHMPNMVAPTLMQRLCQLLGRQVTVALNYAGSAPLTGTLHAVGQDYLELLTGTANNTQVMIVPLWNVGVVMAAGAMNDICPPTTQPPHCPGPGMGGNCPPPIAPPGMGGMTGGMMGPGGMMGGMPGMMGVKDDKEEK